MFQPTEKKSLFKRFINKFFEPKITIGSIASFIATAIGVIAAINPDLIPHLLHIGEKESPKYEKIVRNYQDLRNETSKDSQSLFDYLDMKVLDKKAFNLDVKIPILGVADPMPEDYASRWFAKEEVGYVLNEKISGEKFFVFFDVKFDKNGEHPEYSCTITEDFYNHIKDKKNDILFEESPFKTFPCKYTRRYLFPMEHAVKLMSGVRLKGNFLYDKEDYRDIYFKSAPNDKSN